MRRACLILFSTLIFLTARAQTFSIDPALGYQWNVYTIGKFDGENTNVTNGTGYTLGSRFWYHAPAKDMWSIGFGLFYNEYSGGVYEKFSSNKLHEIQMNVTRRSLSTLFYPISLRFLKQRLQLSIGFQNDLLISESTYGSVSTRQYSSNGQYIYSRTELTYDSLQVHRNTVSGIVFSLSAKVMKVGNWEILPRAGVYLGISSDFGRLPNWQQQTHFHSNRFQLELTMRRKFEW